MIEKAKKICPRCSKPIGNPHDHVYYGNEPYCNCMAEPKPDESRLAILPKPHCFHQAECPVVIEQANKQRDLTASIYQQKIEEIFKIIDYIKVAKKYPLVDGQLESMVILRFDIPDKEAKKIVQALKDKWEEK